MHRQYSAHITVILQYLFQCFFGGIKVEVLHEHCRSLDVFWIICFVFLLILHSLFTLRKIQGNVYFAVFKLFRSWWFTKGKRFFKYDDCIVTLPDTESSRFSGVLRGKWQAVSVFDGIWLHIFLKTSIDQVYVTTTFRSILRIRMRSSTCAVVYCLCGRPHKFALQ